MTKRIIALFLCLVACVTVFAGCGGKIPADSEDKGQQFTMYLTENIYNLDPAYAYTNEATRNVVSLLFDTLFTLDENGKVKPSLAKSYKTEETDDGEYFMYIEIRDDARWSDNQPVTADDVVFAWKRLLNPNNSYEMASLLFEIKNARAYNEAEVSKDDIGLIADGNLVTIEFEQKIDYKHFILNLTSLALAPLREDIASKNEDWAKKPGIITTSGPFKLAKLGLYTNGEVVYEDINYSEKKTDENNKVITDKDGNTVYIPATKVDKFKEQRINSFVLERNLYYNRNAEDAEDLDISVIPYRILVDCSLTSDEVKAAYDAGTILYVGDIPMSIRADVKDLATVTDSLSTNVCYLNQKAYIDNGTEEGYQLFAIPEVRQALSMAIDREAIAEAVVFADAATGLVPTGVYDTNSVKSLFRNASSSDFGYLKLNVSEAQALLAKAGITPSDYTFTVTVAVYDEVHMYIAEAIVAAWNSLGFNVSLNTLGTIANNDHHRDVASIPSDLCDDLWEERVNIGDFEVAILDLVAPSVDPFSVLAPFAKAFSGQKMDMSSADSYELTPHITGYDSEEYNECIEKVYNEKNIANRSADLHAAEEILMNDLPVIPIIFNKNAYLLNEGAFDLNNKILFWNKATDYYCPISFEKFSVKNYEEYTTNLAKYVYDNFDSWKTRPTSYFGGNMYAALTVDEFITENSNYLFLFKNKEYDFITTETEEETTATAE